MRSRATRSLSFTLTLTAALAACDRPPSGRAPSATPDATPDGDADGVARDAPAAAPGDRSGPTDHADARRDAAADDAPSAPPPVTVLGAAEDQGNVVCSAIAPPAMAPCAEHDEAWLAAVYGVYIVRAAPSAPIAHRVVEVIEREGPVAVETWVVDETGAPRVSAPVVFCYPAAGLPAAPGCDANLVPVATDGQGKADFVMTGSGYIGCGQPGPYAAWVDEPGIPSDRVYGLGMLVNTNHRHVNVLFQRVAAASAPAAVARCPL